MAGGVSVRDVDVSILLRNFTPFLWTRWRRLEYMFLCACMCAAKAVSSDFSKIESEGPSSTDLLSREKQMSGKPKASCQ